MVAGDVHGVDGVTPATGNMGAPLEFHRGSPLAYGGLRARNVSERWLNGKGVSGSLPEFARETVISSNSVTVNWRSSGFHCALVNHRK